ncbi:MAG: MarR family transcriptional regulator [Frankiales bacterium]|nr:MarR family transcriptional regulator [Frankiales bacterium]
MVSRPEQQPPDPASAGPSGAPADGAARPTRPENWVSSEVSEAFYAVLNQMPTLRVALARRLGLNQSEVDAMEHLMGEPMGPVELSRRLHMTSASATVLVDRLEEAGHVVREPDVHDGRRRVVRPTAQGATAVFQQIGPLVADLVAAEDVLDPAEREAVVRYLTRVREVLTAHAERL